MLQKIKKWQEVQVFSFDWYIPSWITEGKNYILLEDKEESWLDFLIKNDDWKKMYYDIVFFWY